MNIRSLVDSIVAAADAASTLIPQAGLITKGVELGEKVIDIIDMIDDDIPVDKQEEAQAARAKLAATVKSKAAATADRLRG